MIARDDEDCPLKLGALRVLREKGTERIIHVQQRLEHPCILLVLRAARGINIECRQPTRELRGIGRFTRRNEWLVRGDCQTDR